MPELDESFYQTARIAALGAAVAVGLAWERMYPHTRLRPAWGTNVGLWVVDTLLLVVVCGACGWIVAAWAAGHQLGLFPWVGAGAWVAVVAGILALDAVSYVWHRANHQVPLLWRFHQVHHSDTSFHLTTALRFHPGELLLALPVRLAAIVALGIPPEGVLAFEVVFGIANLLEHGNFDLPRRFEPAAQRLFITPALHRRHHTADWRELDTNFGTVFSVWDRVARTYRSSRGEDVIETGLPGWVGSEAPLIGQSLLLPFRRTVSPPTFAESE